MRRGGQVHTGFVNENRTNHIRANTPGARRQNTNSHAEQDVNMMIVAAVASQPASSLPLLHHAAT